jgi:hypothetical protein
VGPDVRALTGPAAPGHAPDAAASRDARRPGLGVKAAMPEKASLDYIKVLIEVAVLLLALPYLLRQLASHPKRVARGSAKKTAGI